MKREEMAQTIQRDFKGQKNEPERAKQMHRGWSNDDIWWKLRILEATLVYKIQSVAFLLAIIIVLLTRDLAATILFLIWVELWRLDANIRGFTLHGEGLIEYLIKKRI